jgi:hypothetical protein
LRETERFAMFNLECLDAVPELLVVLERQAILAAIV